MTIIEYGTELCETITLLSLSSFKAYQKKPKNPISSEGFRIFHNI